jgi:phage gpG-like protein
LTAAVTFHWVPDPKVHADTFYHQASMFENTAVPIAAAGGAIRSDIRERFDTETDPWGQRWEDWSKSYTPVAMAYPNEGILKQSGDLYRAAISTNATIVTDDTVFYETGRLPHYGLAHEEGLPDRERPLPQRAFLGLSPESTTMIYGIFEEWFNDIVRMYPTPGGVKTRHSFRAVGPGGGFFLSRSAAGL